MLFCLVMLQWHQNSLSKSMTAPQTCLLDTGASHSCISYECFQNAFPNGQLQEIQCIRVQNASGKSMEPRGLCEATVTLGLRTFVHTFIVCKELTSSVILGLDFSSQFLIGTDWTNDRRMYLHQGKHKLIEGTVTSVPANEACLVLKTQVTLPPRTIGIVPVKATEPKLVQSNQYYQSEPNPHFQTQYPDVAAIPLLHQTAGKNPDELVTCLVNPSEWEVILPKNKTVQHIYSIMGKVQINRSSLEQNDEAVLPKAIEPANKEANTGIVMPADYSPHQKFELEDYEIKAATKMKLQEFV